MLVTTQQLTTEDLNELNTLVETCRDTDKNVLPIYPHILIQNRTVPCIIRCYEQEQLIGFLSTFFFYEDAAEVAVMVAPTKRRQGKALQMLDEITPILQGMGMTRLYFSTPSGLNGDWLSAYDFHYHNSEYQMQRHTEAPMCIEDKSLVVRLATDSDIPNLAAIDSACFLKQNSDMSTRFYRLISDPNYRLFIAYQHGVPVGKAHLCWQPDGARLTDVAIIPRLQGQGLGRALLMHCINDAVANDKHMVRLDVESINQAALHLYTRLGFEISNAYDYWETPFTNKALGPK